MASSIPQDPIAAEQYPARGPETPSQEQHKELVKALPTNFAAPGTSIEETTSYASDFPNEQRSFSVEPITSTEGIPALSSVEGEDAKETQFSRLIPMLPKGSATTHDEENRLQAWPAFEDQRQSPAQVDHSKDNGNIAAVFEAERPRLINPTNSFPAIPSTNHQFSLPIRAVASSQLDDSEDSPQAEEKDSWIPSSTIEASSELDSSTSPLGLNIISTAATPPDEESRYEEGIPLIQTPSEERNINLGYAGRHEMNGSIQKADLEAEDRIFQVQSSEPRLHRLDRKSTDQVLAGLNFEGLQRASASDLPEQTHQQRNSDSNQELGNMRSAPKIGEELELVTRPHSASEREIAYTTMEPSRRETDQVSEENTETWARLESEEELAVKWAAALAEDELLDENPRIDPSAFFDDDGEGFLDDAQVEESRELFPQRFGQAIGENVILESLTRQRYQVPQYSTLEAQDQWQSPPSTNIVPERQNEYNHGHMDSLQRQPFIPSTLARPTAPQRTQSFADQAKGGYQSPYDLPMDVSRPRRRAPAVPLVALQAGANSMPILPPEHLAPMESSLPVVMRTQFPPTVNSMLQAPSFSDTILVVENPSLPPAQGRTMSFFEELPSTSKPRPAISSSRIMPAFANQPPAPTIYQPSAPAPLLHQFPSQAPTSSHQAPPIQLQRYLHQSQGPLQPRNSYEPNQNFQSTPDHQLVMPDRVLPFADAPTSIPPTVSLGPSRANARYSPAPVEQPISGRSGYSSQAQPRPPSVSQVMSFQPRTSSPLARSISASQPTTESRVPFADSRIPPNEFRPETTLAPPKPPTKSQITVPPPSTMPNARYNNILPPRPTNYHHPLEETQIMSHMPDLDPRPTQSAMAHSSLPIEPPERPQFQRRASINDPTSPLSIQPTHQAVQSPSQLVNGFPPQTGKRAIPEVKTLIRPTDGREFDGLQRWKGCPIFAFGFGGHIVTSFPQQTPRYTPGSKVPLFKCSPGEVKIQKMKLIPLEARLSSFPGPLKSKGKKKDALEWLDGVISGLIDNVHLPPSDFDRKRHEDKIILWKVMRTFVEYDGSIDEKPDAHTIIRQIFFAQFSGPTSQISNDPDAVTGVSQMNRPPPSPVAPGILEDLRQLLLQGEREKAVFLAADQRLWGHAMLIASSLPREIWKQASQEFVRQEVRGNGANTESLAALYDIFAGNWEESVDELVPPSARAGLQLINKNAGISSTKNSLEGLDRWRETVSLVLSNRSADDGKALIALGHMLTTYGRIEAAHTCFLFARTPGLFGGADDAQACWTLLGSNHRLQPFDYDRDLESLLLTEVYDFASSTLATVGTTATAPHLQGHKLFHAMILAEYGFREEAQQYCDAIAGALKGSTKPSPYYHSQLFNALDDLSNRLRQAPKDGSSSWITRPSINGGSVWNRFTQFVAGEENDAVSVGSGAGNDINQGPFAKITGDTPVMSRSVSPNSPSGMILNGNHLPSHVTTTPSSSRYTPHPDNYQQRAIAPNYASEAPNEAVAFPQLTDPYASTPMTLQRSSFSSERQANLASMPSFPSEGIGSRYSPAVGRSYTPDSLSPVSAFKPTASNLELPGSDLPPVSRLAISPRERSRPYVPSPTGSGPRSASYEAPPSRGPRSYEPSPVRDKILPMPANGSIIYEPQCLPERRASEREYSSSDTREISDPSQLHSFEPHSLASLPSEQEADVEAPSYGYQPPSAGYKPYEPESSPTSPTEGLVRKKSFMDDGDDITKQTKPQGAKGITEADRKVDDAFRRAAEEDAKREKASAAGPKGSWFGGWLGAKGKASEDNQAGTKSKPIKAKLGEEMSLVFDKDLKKWVNKKGGTEVAAISAPAPPPPRGPPSRTPSAMGGSLPRSGIPHSGAISGPHDSPFNTSQSASLNLSSSSFPIAPKDQPQDLKHDLPEIAAGGPLLPLVPPSRPTTGMSGVSNSSSIDDLIGVAGPRKGGTVKRGKKGRGYVDVMAK